MMRSTSRTAKMTAMTNAAGRTRILRVAALLFSGVTGCSAIVDLNGLSESGGSTTCEGGACADAASDAGGTTDAMNAASDAGPGASDAAMSVDDAGDATDGAIVHGVTYVTSAAQRGAGSAPTSVTVTLPVAPQAGDFMLAVAYSDKGASTIAPHEPSTWTSQTPTGIDPVPSDSQMAWFSRHAIANEPTSITFDFTGSDNALAAVVVYRGVSTTKPVDTSFGTPNLGPGAFCGDTTPLPAPYNYNPTPTACATPVLTTTHAGDMLVLLYALDSNATLAPPSWTTGGGAFPDGTTARQDLGNVAIADIVLGAAGATNVGPATHTQTPGYAAVQVLALTPQ
jgi:hypothetical protein